MAQRYYPMGYGWRGGWAGYYPYARPYGYARPYYYGRPYMAYPPIYAPYAYPWVPPPVAIVRPVYVPVMVPYAYPVPTAPQAPAVQHCPDGSTVAAGSYCPSPPPVAPPPAVRPERG
jgi:hypothetical protein